MERTVVKKTKQFMLHALVFATLTLLWSVPAGAAGNTGKGSNPNGRPFVELQGKIVEVQGKVTSLQEQIDSIVARVDTIEARVTADQEAIVSLQQQNVALLAQIEANADDIVSIQAQISTLQGQTALLQSQIDANAGDIAFLQTQVATNNGLIASLQQTISQLGTSLQTQIEHNNLLIASLQNEIQIIQDSLARKQDILNGTCQDGMVLQQINPDGSIVCTVGGGGSAGIEVVSVSQVEEVPPYSWGTAIAPCPAGYIWSGGGFYAPYMEISASLPYAGATAHIVLALNNNYFSSNLISIATCIK